MQGYGSLHRGSVRLCVVAALVVLASAVGTACSVSTDTTPSRIVLPPTDVLSTESEVTTTSVDTGPTTDDTATALPNWTIGRVVALAPRVDNGRYHQGSVTPESPLVDTSGFHFSTPDRAVNCSTGTNGTATLACRLNGQSRGTPPTDTPAACRWIRNLVTLSTEGPQRGACANRYPVLYRSTIVDYGHTIALARFSCLVETAGLFCLESRSRSGFAVTPTGYREISAGDRAPSALTGISESDSRDSVSTTRDREAVTTTPAVPTS
ncbi:hypothetical protein [Gordonia insulae]|uniref:Ig-like domain-containing protein n=1 Tax=Gordonia insulae TaxID=2420509 RepID=A0A3G8JU03_9ACTN|nr:hypothetical protein [Gordonia insulae]AZG48641.1 hypothetical protein D7316_05261 [Gordonia insulae]